MIARIVAICFVFGMASIAWMVLGGVMTQRTWSQGERLGPEVQELWGREHVQQAPQSSFQWEEEQDVQRVETNNGQTVNITEHQKVRRETPVRFSSTDIKVDLALDQRLKGLMWYSLYNVDFDASWTYKHRESKTGKLHLAFEFPVADGLYDGFRFVVNGEDRAANLQPENGKVSTDVEVKAGDSVLVNIAYRSRGANQWRYVPATAVSSLENFKLQLTTDFDAIDFPAGTISPSLKTPTDGGYQLTWEFKQVVTGQGIGMRTPTRLQPGELAASLSFSAPISLLFYFLILFVLGTLRRIDIHPINYLFVAGAFFGFHLLFAYSVDHLHIVPAFALSSAVSMVLVVSYLRLVVSSRFAFVEAALAQLVYLVGFSLAYFWEGFTGLTVTILSIVTLFVLMQLTGRVKWSEVFARSTRRPSEELPAAAAPAQA